MIRRLLTALGLFAALFWSHGAHATWTLVQHKVALCSSANVTTCSVSVTSTGAGHVIVAMSLIFDGTTTMSTSPTNGGNYTHCTSCRATDGSRGTDAWYTLSSSSGATSIVANWSAATQGDVEVWELSTTATAAFDTSGATTNTTGAGVGLTLTGTDDAILQGIVTAGTVTGISAGYTNDDANPDGNGFAHAINTSSGAAPTWTGPSGVSNAVAGIAFSDSGGGGGPTCPQTLALMGVGC